MIDYPGALVTSSGSDTSGREPQFLRSLYHQQYNWLPREQGEARSSGRKHVAEHGNIGGCDLYLAAVGNVSMNHLQHPTLSRITVSPTGR